MQTHEQYNGIFLPNDSQFVGHLNIAGAGSTLRLVGKDFWGYPRGEFTDIHGILVDGKKASILDCVIQEKKQYRFDKDTQFESVFFPNFIVIGEEFISSDELIIQAVRYHFDNIASLVSGSKTFRSLWPDAEEARRILEEDHKRSEKIAEEHGWSKPLFNPEISEHPHLLYYSGLWEIIALQSRVGKISLTNRPSFSTGNAAGVGISNQVVANIEFTEPKSLIAVIHELQNLHGLFELSLGHRQRYRWIELELIYRSKETERDMPQTVRLYWSLCNERVKNDSKVSLNDILLAPDRRPEEFTKVAAGWMNSTENMLDPRERFATAFFGPYSINRIVGAANMFDLLPESHAPTTKEVDAPLRDAVIQCRKIFSDLPESFARQSVLSALGRIGKASLRDKIYYRAEKIIAVAGRKFPELHLPCHQAVICRNHYVHGSKRAFDYQENITEFAFITDTLEFVFAVSDLLDLGWDFSSWLHEGMPMTHPFGAYVINYSQNIAHLKEIV